MRYLRTRLSPSMAVALLALMVALGGTAGADTVAKVSALITGKKIAKNAITTKHVKNRSLLAADFKPGQLPRGAQGPQGPQGPAGANGANATALWAVVRENGSLARGSGVVSSNLVENGGTNAQYQVVFNRDVRNCNWQATVGSPDSINITTFIIPEMITTAGMSSNDNGIAVNVYDPDSQGQGGSNFFVKDDFHLAVFC
jgi:hypothetical protein